MLARYTTATLLLFALSLSPCFAEQLTLRQWLNDAKLYQTKVMEPLKARLQGQPCIEDMGTYLGAYFNQLSEIRMSVNPTSYLLFREMGLASGEEIGRFEDKINCSVVERWQLMSHVIEKKIEFISNVFSLLE